MLDIRLVREDPKEVRANLARRHDPSVLQRFDSLLETDKKYREALKRMESLKAERNLATEEIARLKREKKPAERQIASMKRVSDDIKSAEAERDRMLAETQSLLMRIPNILHESVPLGKDDSENKVVRKVGSAKFPKDPKDHLTILEGLGLIDSETARGPQVL